MRSSTFRGLKVSSKLGAIQCSNCRFFNNNPADLEGSMVGLRVMGSGHSSVVSNDGICENLDRYLSGRYSCDLYEDKA